MGSPQTPIQHIIILMLENRSFDHMLGSLKQYGMPELEGITDYLSNPFQGEPPTKTLWSGQNPDIYFTRPDPEHEFPHVNVQLFGTSNPAAGAVPTNSGFLQDYANVVEKGALIGFERAKEVMRYFRPEQVPIISNLAKNYVVCDHWFSSVPGSTWPNRFFVQCATSNGELITPSGFVKMEEILAKFKTYQMKTIYESLDEAKLTWRVYHDDTPQVLFLANVREKLKNFVDNFKPLDTFKQDAENNNLPNYTFIEPRHMQIIPGVIANDQHPPFDVRAGERLIAEVYNAIRGNEDLWKKSLLILLYDEHGGFFDHVPPPKTVSPDSTNPTFQFDRLGVRVPAILISPYLRQNLRVDSTVYDHTSVLATAKKLFDLPFFLTARDANAQTFEKNFDFSSPRSNCLPPFIESDFLDVGIPETRFSISSLADMTEYQVMLYLMGKFLWTVKGFEHVTAIIAQAEQFLS